MKTYSIIITLVAALAIGAAGYFYWQYSEANKQVLAVKQEKDGVQKDLDQAKRELANVKMSFDGIKPFSVALKAVVDSFVVAGDTKVSTIGSDAATTARQKIGDITDNTDKIRGPGARGTYIGYIGFFRAGKTSHVSVNFPLPLNKAITIPHNRRQICEKPLYKAVFSRSILHQKSASRIGFEPLIY